jgi:DNA-binding NarL/FixJ family response regulator
MKILIIYSSTLFRDGLASLIRSQGFFNEVRLAASITEAIDATDQMCPNVVVLPFKLGDISGIDILRAVRKYMPEARFFFLVDQVDPQYFLSAMLSGVKGYMHSSISADELLTALVKVAKGEAVICGRMLNVFLDDYIHMDKPVAPSAYVVDEGHLTARELDVLYQLTLGASNQEIAERLFVSENTVKNHVHNILTKLKLNNRREALNFAYRFRENISVGNRMMDNRLAVGA